MKIKVPTSWAEISLKQYIEVADVLAIDMDELDKQVKIVSILTKEPEATILEMNLTALKEAIRLTSFIYTKPKTKGIKHVIRLGLQRFEINYDLKKINAGEYIDLTSMTKDKDLITQNLPMILAIFFHPINIIGRRKKNCYVNGSQTLESRIKTSKLIEKHLMMDDVMQLSSFFLTVSVKLTEATIKTIEKSNKKIAKELNELISKDLQTFGDGI